MEMPEVAVHFACRHCEKIYVASQESRRGTGTFNCLECAKQVHQWSGNYNFADWKPVQSVPS
jgi:hypothetical protein